MVVQVVDNEPSVQGDREPRDISGQIGEFFQVRVNFIFTSVMLSGLHIWKTINNSTEKRISLLPVN